MWRKKMKEKRGIIIGLLITIAVIITLAVWMMNAGTIGLTELGSFAIIISPGSNDNGVIPNSNRASEPITPGTITSGKSVHFSPENAIIPIYICRARIDSYIIVTFPDTNDNGVSICGNRESIVITYFAVAGSEFRLFSPRTATIPIHVSCTCGDSAAIVTLWSPYNYYASVDGNR